MEKITIIGAGRVGESTAQVLAVKELAREVVLLDVRPGAARGSALDIQESAPLYGFDTRLSGDTDHAAMSGSNLVVITAGFPRKPGMSRSDVLESNMSVVMPLVDDVARYAPDAIIVMVTNPVDVLTYQTWKRTGWDRNRIFGLSGVLDAARMATFVAAETGFSSKDVTAMVLGGHGDAMVPMPRFTSINGIPLDQFLSEEQIERIIARTRQGGAEILALKKTSSANDSPAAAIATMVDAVANDRRRILPCVAVMQGEYGEEDIAMGVPCVIARDGMHEIVELRLNEEETEQFRGSAQCVRTDIDESR